MRVDEPLAENVKQFIFSTSSDWRVNLSVTGTSGNPQLKLQVGNEFRDEDCSEFGTMTITEDTWYHVAVTISKPAGGPVTAKLYVNGAASGSERSSIPQHYYDQILGICINGLKNGQKQHCSVTVDDFRIYNKEMTDTGSDIDNLADTNLSTDPAGATPLIKYAFDETSGTSAANTGSIGTVYNPIGYSLTPDVEISPAELYSGEAEGSRKINMKDYAKVAQHWMYTWLWP